MTIDVVGQVSYMPWGITDDNVYEMDENGEPEKFWYRVCIQNGGVLHIFKEESTENKKAEPNYLSENIMFVSMYSYEKDLNKKILDIIK